MSDPFIGEIKLVGFNFPPNGWARCDGQILPIAQHTALFSLYGTTYGGDGESTFALPDLRGRFPMHYGSGPGLPSTSWGQKAGQYQTNIVTANMPPHSHTVTVACNSEGGNTDDPSQKYPAVNDQDQYSDVQNDQMADSICSTEGGGQPFNILNPFLAINFVVALVGVYPSAA